MQTSMVLCQKVELQQGVQGQYIRVSKAPKKLRSEPNCGFGDLLHPYSAFMETQIALQRYYELKAAFVSPSMSSIHTAR